MRLVRLQLYPVTELQYVHGYSAREADRLAGQANTLSELLHHDTVYPPGSLVLECGCGTGAQTVILAARNPGARIVAVDISAASLVEARARIAAAGHRNVEFRVANLFDLPFADEHFDHVFVCFLLEHVAQPAAARAVQCLVDVQARFGGDALIGRRLYPLLTEAGFRDVRVSPRMVYVDDSRPHLVEGFSKNTFIAMVEGVRDQALSLGMVDRRTWENGLADLYRATEPGGTFCYTFFKATASQ